MVQEGAERPTQLYSTAAGKPLDMHYTDVAAGRIA